MNLVRVEFEGGGGDGARVERILDAGPDLGAITVDAHRGHHRLHRRVGEERHPIVRGHHLCGLVRHRGGLADRLVEGGEDRGARDVAVPGIVVGRGQRGQCHPGAPVAVGDDGHRLVELHHAGDPRHRLGRGGVDRDEHAALYRCDIDGGVEHARQREVDAVDGAPVDFGRNVEPRRGRATQRVGLRVLQVGTRGHRLRRRCPRQLTEGRTLAGAGMRHPRLGRRAVRCGDTEPVRRGLEQHLLGGGAGQAHAVMPRAPDSRRTARGLRAEPPRQPVGAIVDGPSHGGRYGIAHERTEDERVGIHVEGRRLFDPDLGPVGLHLLGRHHRQPRQRPLSHFAMRDEDRHEVVRRDRDPGRQFALLFGVSGHDAVSTGREDDTADPQDEPAADQAPGADERASCPPTHRAPLGLRHRAPPCRR